MSRRSFLTQRLRRRSAAAALLGVAVLASACGQATSTTAPGGASTTSPTTVPGATAPVPATTPSASSTTPTTSSAPTSTAGVSASAIHALIQEGIDQANGGMVDQAVATFKDVLLLSPKNTLALYNLGLIYQIRKDDKVAIGYYNMAIGADPTYTPAMYNEAIILESSNLDAALALYEKIVKINPKASTAYLRMAFVYAKQGKASLAAAARQHAVKLDPTLAKITLPAPCVTPTKPNC